jgi:hypothetical protein
VGTGRAGTAFPKQENVEITLLRVIAELGGSAMPKDVYPLVARYFPDLSREEQEQRLEGTPSTRKWWNLMQWVRQGLVERGEIDRSSRGVWRITDAGRPLSDTLSRLSLIGTLCTTAPYGEPWTGDDPQTARMLEAARAAKHREAEYPWPWLFLPVDLVARTL